MLQLHTNKREEGLSQIREKSEHLMSDFRSAASRQLPAAYRDISAGCRDRVASCRELLGWFGAP